MPVSSRATKSIAVLPFTPTDDARRDEVLETGIADVMIRRLSSMEGFIVRSLSATREYRNVVQDPVAAGREQQVAFRYLEQLYKRREIWMAYLRVDPRLDPLRNDPRFNDLLRRFEIK
ncbi:MAG TPA: hypothetical protein VJ875_06795 [Pyrinomonadaceae bacterium]|nr:hypothetical protein [Pyrinomonadaceae bacterium]